MITRATGIRVKSASAWTRETGLMQVMALVTHPAEM